MTGFRSDQLREALKRNLPPLCAYAVRSSDRLPRRAVLQRPACLIVNTQPADAPGEHWQAVYLPPDDAQPEFFCSNGGEMDAPIVKFLRLQGSHALINGTWLQHPLSVSCGLFALDFLLYRASGLGSYSAYADRFSPRDWTNNERELWRHWRLIPTSPARSSFRLRHSSGYDRAARDDVEETTHLGL